jgi:hypothetical protein
VSMKFNFKIDRRNTYLLWYSGGFKSS